MTADPAGKPKSPWPARIAILAVASASFMQSADTTALSTALPTLSRAFDAPPLELKVCLTAYIVALAVFTPASAWLADRFGARRVFVCAMLVFLLGSVLCAQSGSLPELVLWRVLQGCGGAMMTPVGRSIVVGSQSRENLVKAMAWMSIPAVAGPIVGPPLAGFILSVAGWPWIFYINLPVGLLGMAAVLRFVPAPRVEHPGAFDGVGFGMAATGICCAMIGAESMGVQLLPRWAQVAAWVAAVVLIAAYVRHAARSARPVLDLRLYGIHAFRAAQSGAGLIRIIHGAIPFLLPLMLQVSLGWSPLKAGLVTMVSALGSMCARLGAQFVVRRFGFKTILMVSGAACGVSVACIGFFRPETPIAVIVVVLWLGGFLRANHLTLASSLSYADVPNAQVSQASSLMAVAQQITVAVGVTVGGMALQLSQQLSGGRDLSPQVMTAPFVVIGVAGLLCAASYVRLPQDAGSAVSGRKAS